MEGLRLLALVFICLHLKLPLKVRFGVLQTVQRAEFWGAILVIQAHWPCHLGIENLDVARTIGRLLDRDCLAKLLPLVKDGDLVALAQYMIRTRARQTVRSLQSRVMPLILMLTRAVFGLWISWGMRKLILLLI